MKFEKFNKDPDDAVEYEEDVDEDDNEDDDSDENEFK